MYKIRKLCKYYVFIIAAITIIYFTCVAFFAEPKEYTDNKYKLGVIEHLIKSTENQGTCQIPLLQVYAPEMMSFVHVEPLINCGTEEDWVVCKKSNCMIKKSIINRWGNIICDFTDILRTDDYNFKYGQTHRTNNAYVLTDSDFAKVNCWTEDEDSYWSGIVIGIRKRVQKTYLNKNHESAVNVLMYGFDSLSRNAFIRSLPKSYKYLSNNLNADILEGYNIIGDGTPQALIPILTGFTELELPETRKRMRDSTSVNVYPMIWQDYEKMGYLTAFNEDVPSIGTFSYRLNGFEDQPTHHYMRTYYLAIESELSSYKKLCVGQLPRHKIMLDYSKQFMTTHTDMPRFAFSFHGELSHDSINLITVADDDIKNWLEDLQNSGILNTTILIIMSDHGNRFAKVRDTLQGKLEERLPFFSFIFPEWFKLKYKEEYANFKENILHLTTPFDIHATLQDILRLQSPGDNNIYKSAHKRSISLFDKIPKDRSCADAYIEPHWCSCLNWRPINDTQSEDVVGAAKAVVQKINEFTKKYHDICERLYLQEIKWAAKLAPHDNLLRFKQNKDFDGFLADLSSKTRVLSEMYQVKIVVKPGNSIFEASVTYNLVRNQFVVKMSDISRVNKYGSQALCIYKSDPELRKYCFCKNQNTIR